MSKSCKVCDRQIQVLEKLSNELDEAGVQIIKVNDKKIAKQHSIAQFPTLTYFKGGDPNNYHGKIFETLFTIFDDFSWVYTQIQNGVQG